MLAGVSRAVDHPLCGWGHAPDEQLQPVVGQKLAGASQLIMMLMLSLKRTGRASDLRQEEHCDCCAGEPCRHSIEEQIAPM
jgi:hypothetical protein